MFRGKNASNLYCIECPGHMPVLQMEPQLLEEEASGGTSSTTSRGEYGRSYYPKEALWGSLRGNL